MDENHGSSDRTELTNANANHPLNANEVSLRVVYESDLYRVPSIQATAVYPEEPSWSGFRPGGAGHE